MTEINQDECRVYTTAMTPQYPKPMIPYNNCEIVCGINKPSALMEELVYHGTYQECVDWVKINCKNCKGL